MTYDYDRLTQELIAVGLNPTGFNNGEPCGDWEPGNELARLACDLHIADQGLYLKTDLDNWAGQLATKLGDTSPEWIAYRKVQADMIRACRAYIYNLPDGPNAQFMESISDGAVPTQAALALVAAKEEIQKAYPWPGSYRGTEEPTVVDLLTTEAPTIADLPKPKRLRKKK